MMITLWLALHGSSLGAAFLLPCIGFVATGTALLIAGLAGAAGTTATSLYAAHTGSEAAKDAAKLSTDSTNKAAELQAQSARESLDFLKQKEATARGDYEAREARLAPYRDLGAWSLGADGAGTSLRSLAGGTGAPPPPAGAATASAAPPMPPTPGPAAPPTTSAAPAYLRTMSLRDLASPDPSQAATGAPAYSLRDLIALGVI